MINTNGAPQRARWAVMWIGTKGKNRRKLVRHNFGDDYASAEILYLKARDQEKPYATLACVNMGFPPPKELRPYMVLMKGRDKVTRKVRVVEVERIPLRELNLQGKLWCPYCRAMRTFVLRKTYLVDGIRIADPVYRCPICHVTQRDYHVRHWNPTATTHMESSLSVFKRKRGPSSSPRRKRRVR